VVRFAQHSACTGVYVDPGGRKTGISLQYLCAAVNKFAANPQGNPTRNFLDSELARWCTNKPAVVFPLLGLRVSGSGRRPACRESCLASDCPYAPVLGVTRRFVQNRTLSLRRRRILLPPIAVLELVVRQAYRFRATTLMQRTFNSTVSRSSKLRLPAA
jgi:hypothetical protein